MKYYILKDGRVMLASFDTLEECRDYGVNGGYGDFAIIQIVEFVD